VLYFAVASGQPGANFVRVVMKGPHPPAIRDVPGFIDNVKPLRPGGVSRLSDIVNVVDTESDRILKARDEIVRDGHALYQVLRLRVTDVFLHVRLHLPLIRRVRFANINRQKIRVVFVVVVNLHHVTDVAAERRSSVAAEDEHQRAPASPFANVESIGTVKSDEPRVRRVIADFQLAAVHVRQRITHHAVGVLGTARHFAKHEEHG
jgi:hypothetical protein